MMTKSTAMILNPLRQVKRYVRRWQTKFRRRGLILVYHRIATLDSDPWGTSVQEKNFIEQLQVIKQLADPIPLQVDGECAFRCGSAEAPCQHHIRRRILDNFRLPRRCSSSFAVPATMFLTTGYFTART